MLAGTSFSLDPCVQRNVQAADAALDRVRSLRPMRADASRCLLQERLLQEDRLPWEEAYLLGLAYSLHASRETVFPINEEAVHLSLVSITPLCNQLSIRVYPVMLTNAVSCTVP